MAPLGPVSRRELIARLRALGFDGPFPGGEHAYMVRGGRRVALPNPHRSAIGPGLLGKVLREAGGDRAEWGGGP